MPDQIIQKKFGRLKVIREVEPHITKGGYRKRVVECTCDCGKTTKVWIQTLLSHQVISCGCEKNKTRHGHATRKKKSKTFAIWGAMRQRCYNPRSISWKDYGGRGIRVCERWNSFETFLHDMGPCPPDHSIERIDNDGNYEPDNCEWETMKNQARNRRTSRIISVRGVTACLSELCIMFGVSYRRTRSRLDLGYTPEQAFFLPSRFKRV